MKTSSSTLPGKIVYSLIFIVLLPALLIFWAKLADHAVTLPAVQSDLWGALLSGMGACLMLAGMWALWRHGKGLPMNAYPPPEFVQQGVYGYFAHPIYLGFGMLCFGVSVYAGSAAGFWLVSPLTAMGMAALVWGYERLDLRKRFPGAVRRFRFSIPPMEETAPAWYHRCSVYLLLLLPWALLTGAAAWAHEAQGAHDPLFSFYETKISASLHLIIAVAAFIWVMAIPLFARTRHQLRDFFFEGLTGGAVALYLAFLAPVLGLSYWLGEGVEVPFWAKAALSISWFWVWLAEGVYRRAFPSLNWLFPLLAVLLSLGVVFNSSDPVSHALTGAVALLVAFFYPVLWEFVREVSEAIANSWKEWRFGKVRVINHGFYVGAGAFLGALTGSLLAGEEYVFPMVVFGFIVTVCSGLWAQFIEGSDKLKRPFGFYGGVVGILFGSVAMYLMDVSVWVMLGVFAVFMPFVQGIGRLRCLVNGCCHGSETSELLGIRYFHPRSRVCFISNLKGKHLHPTPLYSLLWLFVVGGVQVALWLRGAELSLIFATYLMLNGLGRFVEEAYRGEPQTPVLGKLRLYQWAALVSVLAGIAVSMLPSPVAVLADGLTWRTVAWGAAIGGFLLFVMGIDFPESERRFSRLT